MPESGGGKLPPFFEKNLFCVKNVPTDTKRYPKTEIRVEQSQLIALRLAKEGYAGGDPEKILQMKVSTVVMMMQYEKFIDDYQTAYIKLNQDN